MLEQYIFDAIPDLSSFKNTLLTMAYLLSISSNGNLIICSHLYVREVFHLSGIIKGVRGAVEKVPFFPTYSIFVS
jgi:hypothetical protein